MRRSMVVFDAVVHELGNDADGRRPISGFIDGARQVEMLKGAELRGLQKPEGNRTAHRIFLLF